MLEGARYQAVYEILSDVFSNTRAADRIINEYLRNRKYIGSKDRRFITDTVWTIVRHRRRLSFEIGSDNPRAVLLWYLKDKDWDILSASGDYAVKAPDKNEREMIERARRLEDVPYPPDVEAECPNWLFQKSRSSALLQSLNQTAPADLRVNLEDRETVRRRLQREAVFTTPTPFSPYGLRSEDRINLNNCAAYQEGLVEVQDESCQIGAVLCRVRPQEKVIDYCAGAGGKSLAVAAINHNEGTIEAFDKNFNRTDAIKERAARLGIRNIVRVNRVTDDDYDCFILDAPCSGTGTWRRAPDAKYRLTPETLARLTKTQAELLAFASSHVRTGGRIVYMTCSVLAEENENQVEKFVADHPDFAFADHRLLWKTISEKGYPFATEKYLHFAPHSTHTDGFFFCTIVKKN
jgi:16S rRNA (cytosine967-C5)-methyltransferase